MRTLARVRNWSADLMGFANAQQGRPFVWGDTDCCALVRGALGAMYGADVVPGLPAWASEAEAQQVWAGQTLADMLHALGAEVMTLAFRSGGDVLAWPPTEVTGPWPGIGVALPTGQVLVTAQDEGVLIVPAYVLPETAEAYRLPWTLEVIGG